MADDAKVRRRFATARGAVALAVCVGVLCELSITFTRQPGGLSNLWPASGIVAGVLLTTPRSRWNVYIAAALFANIVVRFLHVDTWYSPLVLGAASTFDAVAVAYVLQRFADDI